jgi:tetraacyldisaccharide 4'-kinase
VIKYLRLLLIPFSALFAIYVFIRNKLYDLCILKSVHVSKPVISIGNITTGGTGKTPFIIFLAEFFLKKNKRVAIISRGYKRDTKDLLLVYDGNKTLCGVNECGDELYMITEHLNENSNNFFIAACSDRITAAEMLIDKYSPDVILLDDAFQHRRLYRDLDIVLIDSQDYFKNKLENTFLLPSGNLRECYTSLKRSDLIIQNDKTSNYSTIIKIGKFNKGIVKINYEGNTLVNHKNESLNINLNNAVVFSGLANVESFYELLNGLNINIKEKIKFPDHHKYLSKDIDYIINKKISDCIYITTEKDFVKIKKFEKFINNYSVFYLKLYINLEENSKFLESRLNQIVSK